MSPSSTVYAGQHDTKYLVCDIRVALHEAFVADEIWGFMHEPARRIMQTKQWYVERSHPPLGTCPFQIIEVHYSSLRLASLKTSNCFGCCHMRLACTWTCLTILNASNSKGEAPSAANRRKRLPGVGHFFYQLHATPKRSLERVSKT